MSVLDIDRIDKNASYKCMARSDGNEDSQIIKVTAVVKYFFNIIETPKGKYNKKKWKKKCYYTPVTKMEWNFTDAKIEYTKSGTFTCKIDAFPPVEVLWYAKGLPIKSDDNIEVSGETLSIRRMEPKLDGLYMCEANNGFNRKLTHFRVATSGLGKFFFL